MHRYTGDPDQRAEPWRHRFPQIISGLQGYGELTGPPQCLAQVGRGHKDCPVPTPGCRI